MKCLINAMFLGAHSGTKENGDPYYYGTFMEHDSHKNINLYFDDNQDLKKYELDKWYNLPVELYFTYLTNNQNQRIQIIKMRIDKGALKQ